MGSAAHRLIVLLCGLTLACAAGFATLPDLVDSAPTRGNMPTGDLRIVSGPSQAGSLRTQRRAGASPVAYKRRMVEERIVMLVMVGSWLAVYRYTRYARRRALKCRCCTARKNRREPPLPVGDVAAGANQVARSRSGSGSTNSHSINTIGLQNPSAEGF